MVLMELRQFNLVWICTRAVFMRELQYRRQHQKELVYIRD